nr:MAG TPA: hypothetical protein [Caudoviricetes sp.]
MCPNACEALIIQENPVVSTATGFLIKWWTIQDSNL